MTRALTSPMRMAASSSPSVSRCSGAGVADGASANGRHPWPSRYRTPEFAEGDVDDDCGRGEGLLSVGIHREAVWLGTGKCTPSGSWRCSKNGRRGSRRSRKSEHRRSADAGGVTPPICLRSVASTPHAAAAHVVARSFSVWHAPRGTPAACSPATGTTCRATG